MGHLGYLRALGGQRSRGQLLIRVLSLFVLDKVISQPYATWALFAFHLSKQALVSMHF